MNVPDYVVPIVGFRFWLWDGSKLKSLNGESWYPRRPLTARCLLNNHQPPLQDCRCGIYALKLDSAFRMPILPGMPTLPRMGALPRMRAAPIFVSGEVYLWGTVVEHALGWRAQVAYPKSLVVPFAMVPTGVKQAQSWLQAFVAYGVDIFVDQGIRHIPVWTKKAGYDSAGLDYLRKAATGEVDAAPIAIVTKDSQRHVLQNGTEAKQDSKSVFTDVQVTLKALDRIIRTRWKGPPGGGPPPPPAVPVHSLVDIIRIIHSRRKQWAAQWTRRADRKGQEVCYG
jgi:hypothetical protein